LHVRGGVSLAVDDNLLRLVEVAHISLDVNTASVVPGARPKAAPASDNHVIEGTVLNLRGLDRHNCSFEVGIYLFLFVWLVVCLLSSFCSFV